MALSSAHTKDEMHAYMLQTSVSPNYMERVGHHVVVEYNLAHAHAMQSTARPRTPLSQVVWMMVISSIYRVHLRCESASASAYELPGKLCSKANKMHFFWLRFFIRA